MRRARLGVTSGDCSLVFTAGGGAKERARYLVDAVGVMTSQPRILLAIAGRRGFRAELEERGRNAGVAERVRFLGNLSQDAVRAFRCG